MGCYVFKERSTNGGISFRNSDLKATKRGVATWHLACLHICEGGIFHWQCPRGASISCKPWRGSSITMAIVCLSSDGKLRTFCEFLSWQTYRRQSDPSAFGSSFLIDMPTVFSSLLPSQDRGSDRWRPHTGFYTCTHSPIGGLTVAGGC